MINWIVIIILVIVGIMAIRMNHLKHRIFIILLVILALFLYSTMVIVTNKNQIQLNSAEGIYTGMKVYTGWLANGFQNLKSITGNALKMDWESTDATFLNKSNTKDTKKTVSSQKTSKK